MPQHKDPTEEDIYRPEFDAIWQAIKGWDIQRNPGDGYASATGTDVMTILNALKRMKPQEVAYALPAQVVYYAGIRLGAHATTGKYSSTVVPDMPFMAAIERWFEDHKGEGDEDLPAEQNSENDPPVEKSELAYNQRKVVCPNPQCEYNGKIRVVSLPLLVGTEMYLEGPIVCRCHYHMYRVV